MVNVNKIKKGSDRKRQNLRLNFLAQELARTITSKPIHNGITVISSINYHHKSTIQVTSLFFKASQVCKMDYQKGKKNKEHNNHTSLFARFSKIMTKLFNRIGMA